VGRITILSIIFLYVPAVAANITDLILSDSSSGAFYLDIDSLIIVTYLILIITYVIYKRENVEKSLLNMKALVVTLGQNDDDDELQRAK